MGNLKARGILSFAIGIGGLGSVLWSTTLGAEVPHFSNCVWVEKSAQQGTYTVSDKVPRLKIKSARAEPRAVCMGDAKCEIEVRGNSGKVFHFTALLEKTSCETSSVKCPPATQCVEQGGALVDSDVEKSEGADLPTTATEREHR